MPAGLLPDEGIAAQLEYILKASISGVLPWQLMLFVNDIVPTHATVLADLVEATFQGYARVNLTRSEWTTPTVHDGCAHSTWGSTVVTWYVNGGPTETIYGYAYVDASMGVIRLVQRLDAGDIRPVEIGGKVTMLPEYSLTSAECP
ncbi:MAG: hypothetical protein LLG14_23020 [Nocardiaceae bacterium]|nr:hypothetical protein [Nocardiaceae bacterium]